jgi:hypothetical protein
MGVPNKQHIVFLIIFNLFLPIGQQQVSLFARDYPKLPIIGASCLMVDGRLLNNAAKGTIVSI